MADFKGMSILMNMRDVGIDRTMKQIKGQFKTLNSEMKRSNADFKNSEKSLQNFNQRTKELNKAIDVTENSMKDISNQLKKMTLEEQRTSAEAEKLRQEYSKQHKNLSMYQRQLTSTQNEMKTFNSTNKRAVFSMEKINQTLGTMRKQLNIADTSFKNSGKSVKSYENYLKQLNTVISKHQNTIKVLEGRYKKVVKEQGEMSHEAIDLKQKIQQEKQALQQLNSQYKQTSAEAKRFSFEQKSATQSMSEIRQRISQVAQSLQISASKFKMTGQTAQAYKARISDLNNGMKQQKLIVQNLSRQYDYAKKQYGETSAEAQKLNAELVEERVKLKDLNGQLKQTTQAHNRLEMEQQQGIASMTEIRQKMSGFNDTLSLSRSNLSRAGESVRAYKGHLDTLNTNMSQQRTVLRELNNQYKIVAQTQGKNSAEARELSGAITQQKIRMNELESEIEQTAQSYKKLATQQKQAQALSATGFGRGVQSVNKYNDSIKNVGMSMRSVGTGSLIYMTMPAVAAMGGAIKTSVDWEQALAGVAKTTDMTGKELEGMGNEITAMSNKMPFAATEIAGVAEAAGQLGVKKSEITDFTETMMNMSVATNLSADEAATEFARFSNAAGMPIEDVDRLGAAVVNLGNTTATREKEIVEMGQRLAGAGSQAGFSGDEIMSVSAAMSSVGIEAEAGGTAMTQIFNKMTKATAEGGETLDNFAKTSGMSAKEFSSTWENNPTKALSAFVKGLGDTKGGAKGVLSALDDVGIKGIREADTIRRMSNNHKVLDDALKTGAEGWKENTALTDEAAIRYETMGSKLTVLKNTFVNFLRTIGDAVAPIVIKLADTLTALFKRLQNTSNITKIAITAFTLLAAAIPPILISGGLLLTLLTNMAKSMMFLNGLTSGGGILAGLKVAFSSILSPITQVVTKIPLIGTALGALSGPIGWITLAIVGIGTALVVAYKKSETFRNIVNGAFNGVVEGAKLLWSGIKTILSPIINGFKELGKTISNTLGKFWEENGSQFIQALNNIKTGAMNFWGMIKPIFSSIGGILKSTFIDATPVFKFFTDIILGSLMHAFNMVKESVTIAFNAVKGIIMGVLNIVLGFAKMFIGVFTGDWKKFGEGLKQIISSALSIIKNLFQLTFSGVLGIVKVIWSTIKNTIVNFAKLIWSGVKGHFNNLKNSVIAIFNIVKNFMIKVWTTIKNRVVANAKLLWAGVKAIFNTMKKVITTIFNAVKNISIKVWTTIKNKVIALARSLWNAVRNTFNALKKGVTSIFNSVKNFAIKVWTTIKNKISSIAKSLWNSIRNTFNSLRKGISNIFNAVKNFLIKTWSTIKSKVTGLVKSLWNGVRNTFNSLRKGVSNIFNGVKSNAIKTWNSIKSKITGIASTLWGSVKKTFNNMKNGLKGIIDKIKGHITGMVDTVKKGLNKLIKGVNWVGSKLGMDKIPDVKFHTGTESTHTQNIVTKGKLNRDTLATVGDKGKGNGPGGFRNETIVPPKGKPFITPSKDTTMPLSKGTKILNGAQTHSLLSNSMPKFSKGTSPGDILNSTKGKLEEFGKGLGDKFHGVKKSAAKKYDEGKEKAGSLVNSVKEATGKGAKWLSGKVKDVMDFVKKPGKLLDHVIKAFGVNFDGLGKNTIPADMMGGMFNKLKDAAKNLFKQWMEETGDGSGDASWLFKHPVWQKFGNYTGGLNFNGGKHYGMDFGMPIGTPVKAVADGKVSKVWNDYGGGKSVEVQVGKNLWNWYMHLSKQMAKKGQKVSAGDVIGKSGDTGNFVRGAHLHFQLNKGDHSGNDTAINPEKWLKGLSSSGGSKKASKWKPEVIKALKVNGLPTSSNYVNAWIKQIDSESGGNAGAVQHGYTDVNSGGNEARGLVQVIPPTFNAYKKKGHGNIMNGLDNLMAGMNYAKSKYGKSGMLSVIGKGHGYASGGFIGSEGWYNLAEGGYPEYVISTDPSKADDSMKLLALAAQDIDSKNKRNKRPNQMKTASTGASYNDDPLYQVIENQNTQIEQMQQAIKQLAKLVTSNQIIADKPVPTEEGFSKKQGKRQQMMSYNMGDV